jgi:O-antigen/teichoic acid export membrane protein
MLVLVVSGVLSVALYGIIAIIVLAGLELPGPLAGSGTLWLLPLGAFLLAVREALLTVMIRRREFGIIAWADVVQSGGTLLSRVIWGLTLGSAALGLVLGQFVGVCAAVLLASAVSARWLRTTLASGSLSLLTKVAVDFSDYPKYRVSARLAFQAAEQMPLLALGLMFPVEAVGFFAMAHRVADIPLQAASRALSDAILGNSINKRHDNRPLGPSVWKAAAGLAIIGIPTFTLMFLVGGEVLTWFLGNRWSDAGRMVEILSIYLFFSWMNSAFSPIFETLRKNKHSMMLNSLNLIARAIAFGSCFLAALDIFETLWVFSIVCACHALVSIALAAYVVLRHDARLRVARS